MHRILKLAGIVIAALAAIIVLPLIAGANSGPSNSNQFTSDASSAPTANVDTGYAIVQLQGSPVATNPSIGAGNGHRVNLNAPAVQSYRSQLAQERNAYRQWLNANYPKANVTGQFDIALNALGVQLNGTPLSALSAGPNAVSAQYQGVYHPSGDVTVDPDLTLINAFNAWAANGNTAANAGAGIKVADLDTGIDITNPCFSGAGYTAPAGFPKVDPQFSSTASQYTNNKVIVARIFNANTPVMHYTPAAVQEHGTHTAGTIACNAGTSAYIGNSATSSGLLIPHTIAGVAPRAFLGNYNVFPGNVLNVRDEELFQALEQAYTDGMNVDNMSLGGGYHGSNDLVTQAVDNLDQAGMISAIAAGNSGPGFGTVQSPGSAARGLTAGAATVGHFVAHPVTFHSVTYPGVAGDFGTITSNLTAPLSAVGVTTASDPLSVACSALPDLTGKIALLSRGTCSFSTKIRNAQNAGAVAVVMVNNAFGDPIAMGQDGTANQPTIPAYMVSKSDGATIKAAVLATPGNATIGSALQYFVTGNDGIMASFSSQGPTNDFRVKPDVVAPGVNVLSSIPTAFCGDTTHGCFAFFQGTSMATPHLAGSAAVVEWEHPNWSSAQVRSAIVNTARTSFLLNSAGTALDNNPTHVGAGFEDLNNAVHASVALDPVSSSFGAVPAGSSQSRSASITLSNLTGTSETLSLAAGTDGSGVTFSVSPASVTIPAGGSTSVTVSMNENAASATLGSHYTYLTISSGGTAVAHAALYTFVK
jgi:subtilisin family serine protease